MPTGIFKQPVSGRSRRTASISMATSRPIGRRHGGPDRAAYAYATEDLAWWAGELGRPVAPGAMGENLTTEGLDVTGARVGERWRVGGAVFEVSAPRVPCFKLGIRMGDPRFPPRYACRPARCLPPHRRARQHRCRRPDRGRSPPAHDVTVSLVARAYHDDRALAPLLLAAPELGAGWPEWARDVAVT